MASTHIDGDADRSVQEHLEEAGASYSKVSVATTWSAFDVGGPRPVAPPLVQPSEADTVAEEEGISFEFDDRGRPIAATMVDAVDMGKSGSDLRRWVYRYDCSATPTPDPGANAAPTVDDVIALVEASSMKLDVTPPATLAEHYAKSVAPDAQPTIECSRDGDAWSCSLWGGPDLGFFYSIVLEPEGDGWAIDPDRTEVLADD